MPTVLEVAGIRGPDGDGVSLMPAMNGEHLDLEGVAESMYPLRFGSSPLRMVRDQRYKLIDGVRPELYDLAADPFEERNIYGEQTALAAVMGRRLSALVRQPAPFTGTLAEPSPELRERLQALGYAAGGISETAKNSPKTSVIYRDDTTPARSEPGRVRHPTSSRRR
jgi:hypothetical protein